MFSFHGAYRQGCFDSRRESGVRSQQSMRANEDTLQGKPLNERPQVEGALQYSTYRGINVPSARDTTTYLSKGDRHNYDAYRPSCASGEKGLALGILIIIAT